MSAQRSPRTVALEEQVANLRTLLEERANDTRMLECLVALGVLGVKLNAMAWGETKRLVLDDLELVAKASVALDHLLEERERALEMARLFTSWEFESAQLVTVGSVPTPTVGTTADMERKAERERRRADAAARRDERTEEILARGMA